MPRRLQPSDPAPPFVLPRAAGGDLSSAEFLGRRWLLSFHRYAT